MANSFRKRALLVVSGLTAAVLTLGALAGYAPRQAPSVSASPQTGSAVARPAQPVRVTRVTFTEPPASHSFTGVVRPRHETVMAFRLPGQIVARTVEVGDKIEAGQVLAQLDDTDTRLSLEAADAEVTASRTDLSRAAADFRRSQTLFDAGFVARAGLEKAKSATAQAQARVDRAVRVRDQAANALSYTRLIADRPGVVISVAAEAGQVVAAGQQVVTVASTDQLDVVFALPEQMRTALARTEAVAELWGEAGRSYALTLRDISPDVDPAARTYRVRMSLASPDPGAALGRTMTVTLKAPAAAPVVELPLAAVMNDGLGAFVWRLGQEHSDVERVAVDIVELDEAHARVSGGLREGDLVVSLGANKIDPARPVRVVETAANVAM